MSRLAIVGAFMSNHLSRYTYILYLFSRFSKNRCVFVKNLRYIHLNLLPHMCCKLWLSHSFFISIIFVKCVTILETQILFLAIKKATRDVIGESFESRYGFSHLIIHSSIHPIYFEFAQQFYHTIISYKIKINWTFQIGC